MSQDTDAVAVKILGISGTPIRGGNCDKLVQESLRAVNELGDAIGGIETEFVTLADKKIAMCSHCQWCIENKAPCKIKDDAQLVFDKIIESDGIIFGAPTWVMTLAPPLIVLFSRCRYYAFFTRKFHNKVAGYMTVGFFGFGLEQALDTMENLTKSALLPVARGWALASTAAYGERPKYLEEGVLGDKAGVLRARNVGIRVVEVARMIKYAAQHGIVLPKQYRTTPTGGHWEKPREKRLVEGVWR